MLAPNTSSTTIFVAGRFGDFQHRQRDAQLARASGARWTSRRARRSITITVTASATAALNITGAGDRAGGDCAEHELDHAHHLGRRKQRRRPWRRERRATSDPITYTLNNTVDQIVTIYTTARNVEYYTQLTDETLWSNFCGAGSVAERERSRDIRPAATRVDREDHRAFTVDAVHLLRGARRSTPVAVWENDALLKSVDFVGAVETNAGSWYYDGTYLYLHASDGSNVATNGKTYTYVTASSPSYTTWDNGKTG